MVWQRFYIYILICQKWLFFLLFAPGNINFVKLLKTSVDNTAIKDNYRTKKVLLRLPPVSFIPSFHIPVSSISLPALSCSLNAKTDLEISNSMSFKNTCSHLHIYMYKPPIDNNYHDTVLLKKTGRLNYVNFSRPLRLWKWIRHQEIEFSFSFLLMCCSSKSEVTVWSYGVFFNKNLSLFWVFWPTMTHRPLTAR